MLKEKLILNYQQIMILFGGNEETIEETYEINIPVACPPRTIILAEATIKVVNIDIPYTIIFKSKNTNVKIESKGIYKNVKNYDLKCKFSNYIKD